MSKWNSEREALLSVVQRMASGGLVAGASGNASMCLQRGGDDGLLLITPSQMPYDRMSVEDLVVVELRRRSRRGRSDALDRDPNPRGGVQGQEGCWRGRPHPLGLCHSPGGDRAGPAAYNRRIGCCRWGYCEGGGLRLSRKRGACGEGLPGPGGSRGCYPEESRPPWRGRNG